MRQNRRWDSEEHQRQWQRYRSQVDQSVYRHTDELADGENNRVLVNDPKVLKSNSIIDEKAPSRDMVANMMFDLQNSQWRGAFRVEDGAGVGHHRQMMDFAFRDMGMEFNPETNRYEVPRPPQEVIAESNSFNYAEAMRWSDGMRDRLNEVGDRTDALGVQFYDIMQKRDDKTVRIADLLSEADKVRELVMAIEQEIKSKRAETETLRSASRDTAERRQMDDFDEQDLRGLTTFASRRRESLEELLHISFSSERVLKRAIDQSPELPKELFLPREMWQQIDQSQTPLGSVNPMARGGGGIIEFPTENIVGAPGLIDWHGTDRIKDGEESRKIIKQYAKMSPGTAPSVGMTTMYIQPDGTMFARLVGDGAHRVAAAHRRGDPVVEISGQIGIKRVNHNIV
jgi:hypothetical protein